MLCCSCGRGLRSYGLPYVLAPRFLPARRDFTDFATYGATAYKPVTALLSRGSQVRFCQAHHSKSGTCEAALVLADPPTSGCTPGIDGEPLHGGFDVIRV